MRIVRWLDGDWIDGDRNRRSAFGVRGIAKGKRGTLRLKSDRQGRDKVMQYGDMVELKKRKTMLK